MLQFRPSNILYLIHFQLAEKLYGKATQKGINLVGKVLQEKNVDLCSRHDFKFLHREIDGIVQGPMSRQAKTTQINAKVRQFLTKAKLIQYWTKITTLMIYFSSLFI